MKKSDHNALDFNSYNGIIILTLDVVTETDFDTVNDIILNKKIKAATFNNKIDIANLKNLPNFFFFSFLLIFTITTGKFMYVSYQMDKTDLDQKKFNFSYYPEFFGKENTFIKVNYFAYIYSSVLW